MNPVLLLLFLVSGALALIYQVLWQRQFALLFGSGSAATAVVLAAFFAGLGLGSAWVGRWTVGWRRPLRAYAVLELLIGLGAVLVTPVLSGFGEWYPGLAHRFSDSPGWFVVVKGGIAFLVIGVPTVGMGGTLPVLAQALARESDRWGVRITPYYVANTLGAALGAVSVPWFWLPQLGVRGTLFAGALGNVLVAVLAWRFASRWVGAVSDPERSGTSARPSRLSGAGAGRRSVEPPAWTRHLLLGSVLSGLVTFSLQVLWNRAFAQVHENSLHAFALLAALFILALAVGGGLARELLRRGWRPGRLLGMSWVVGGGLTCLAPWVFLALTNQLSYVGSDAGGWSEFRRLLGISGVVVFVPVCFLGLGFPALIEAAGGVAGTVAGPAVGRVLASNIVGCVSGALLAGFVLPGWCGLWGGMVVTAGLAVLAGVAVMQADRVPVVKRSVSGLARPWVPAGVALVLLVAVGVGSLSLPRVRVNSRQNERLLALRESEYGIVAVTERPGSRRLKLDNHYALGGTFSLGDQRMQAHVPLLLHPDPKRVGHLGLGTGLSAGGILFHPVASVEVVELIPAVTRAAREFFSEGAPGLFDDARVRWVTADARNHLRAGPEPFDVLIGDLVVPWRAGESALFTVEHFTAAKAALRPGGVFCQWLPLFQLTEVETRILIGGFLRVFPRAQVWRGDFSTDRPALALIAGEAAFRLDPAAVRARLAAMRADPLNPQLTDPVGFWMNYVGTLEAGDVDVRESRIHTEDRPWLELLGPRTHQRDRRSQLFVGRALQRWLTEVRERSRARESALTAVEWGAAQSGDALFEFGLCLSERNVAEAGRIRSRLEQQLPPAVVRGIFGGGGP